MPMNFNGITMSGGMNFIGSTLQTDPYFYYTNLLLPGNGTNNQNNNVFLDSSTNNFTITRTGNTTQGSFSPFSQTGWSNYFDGNGDNLLLSYNSAFHLSGDFTIECWFYAKAYGGGMILNFAGGLNIAWASYELVNQSDGIYFAASSNNNGYDIGSEPANSNTGKIGTIQLNTWNHLAVTRSGNVYRGFVNGVQGYTQTLNLTPYNPNARGLAIGSNYGTTWGSGTPTASVNGFISNLRIVKGTALYTANFTPPTSPLTAIANTSLLTCQSNRFIDNSTNNFTITRNGDVSVQSFSPFNPTSAWSAGNVGGSAYFDGSGDYLSNTSGNPINFGTGAFTVEMWLNATTISTSAYEVVMCSNPQSNGGFQIYNRNVNRALVFGAINASEYTIISDMLPNRWYHIAISRVSTSANQTHVFVDGNLIGSYTVADNFNINGFNLGGYNSSIYWNGYISNVRVVKGTAIYTSAFTPPTAPLTNIANTSLLTNFTNAGITDATAKNVLETVGDAKISTIQSKFGGSSMFFDGTGDWLRAQDNVNLQLAAGNFTIELWVYLASEDIGSNRALVAKGGASTGWAFGLNTTEKVVFTHTTSTITSSGAITTNAWNHIAVVREGTGTNQTKIYVNGINDGTGTVSTNFNQIDPLYVGAGRTTGNPMKGYIDDLRITKGYARYTANFTPPSTAFPLQ